jgi:hypothetical protein
MGRSQISYYLRKRFGLNSFWKARERQEVIKLTKPFWEKLKEENGCIPYGHKHIEEIPGFLESLEILANSGFGYTDIGTNHGFSRQRTKQIFEKNGLKPGPGDGSMFRIWNEEKSCFFPISCCDFEKRLKESYERTRLERKMERKEKIKESHIREVQNFYAEKGRVPSSMELVEILGYFSLTNIAKHWGYIGKNGKVSSQKAIDTLYLAAGFNERRAIGGYKGSFPLRKIA